MHPRRKTNTVQKWTLIAIVLALSYLPSSPSLGVYAKESSSSSSPPAEALSTLAGERTFVAPQMGGNDPQPITDRKTQSALSQAPPSQDGPDGSVPLEWVRGYLGTKSPYPHYNRPVGPLNDIPEGYELAQLQLVRWKKPKKNKKQKSQAVSI